jgi:hypothetical protein
MINPKAGRAEKKTIKRSRTLRLEKKELIWECLNKI